MFYAYCMQKQHYLIKITHFNLIGWLLHYFLDSGCTILSLCSVYKVPVSYKGTSRGFAKVWSMAQNVRYSRIIFEKPGSKLNLQDFIILYILSLIDYPLLAIIKWYLNVCIDTLCKWTMCTLSLRYLHLDIAMYLSARVCSFVFPYMDSRINKEAVPKSKVHYGC